MAAEIRSNQAAGDLRAYLKSLMRSSHDAVVTKTLDGTVTGWNPAAERMFGYSAEFAVGRNLLSFGFIPPERVHEEADILARIGRGEPFDELETVRVCQDGRRIDVSVTVLPILDDTGHVVGACKFARDLSERKRTEDRLVGTMKELEDIKAALDEHSIVAITDAAGRITSVNEKFCAISQYSRDELIGHDHRIINSGYHPKSFFQDLWTTIGRGQTWRGEIKNRAKNGTTYWVDTTIFPCLGTNGKPNQYVAIRTDITQRKADQVALQRYAEQLAEKNKELETIVYTVSHDLRSPLVNVQGFGKRLARACEAVQVACTTLNGSVAAAARDALDSTIPQSLRFINAGMAKMDTLLTGLLRYSRLGREALVIERLDMNALVAEALSAVKFQLEAAKADVGVGPLPSALGDRVQTSQVFSNLVDNALKYRHPDRALRLAIAGRIEGGQAVFSVRDNGVGIAKEHQAKVFEIFHRLNPEGTAGEGLGLTIAQRILERQHGKIWVESTAGEGASFLVSLPAAAPDPHAAP